MAIVYENPWFQVRSIKTYHVVDQPHSSNAASIIPRLPDGSFLLIRTWRIATKKRLTEFPRGCAVSGETKAQCAARELFKQTGYKMPADKMVQWGTIHPDTGILSAEINFFYADLSFAEPLSAASKEEVLGTMEVSDDALRNMVDHGLITDSFTLAALGKYWNKKYLGEIS